MTTSVGTRNGGRPGAVAELDRVTKRFGDRTALWEATVSVGRGEILGVVGLNGAGKTTLLRVMVGLIRPDRGTVRVCGRTITRQLACRHTVFFSGGAMLPGALRVSDWARVHGMAGTLGADRRRIRALSRGQRQAVGLRVALARAPLHLVVLDEPWDGLDPEGTGWLMHVLREVRDAGAAVVVSSHRLLELASIATRHVVLHDGVVVEVAGDGAVVGDILRSHGPAARKGANTER